MNIFLVQDSFRRLFAKTYTALGAKSFQKFGKGSIIYFPARIHNQKNITVGKNVIIQSNVWLNPVDEWAGIKYSGHIEISDNTAILNNTQISSVQSVYIGKNICIGRNSAIVDHIHDYTFIDRPIAYAPLTEGKPVHIGDDTFIGVNCVVGPGVTIGRHCFIAANSLVNSNIPDYSFAGGVPAKVLRRYCPEKRLWEAPRGTP